MGTFLRIGVNTLTIGFILLFSIVAWFAKGIVEKHITISALGVLIVCFLANASVLLPSSSVLIVVEFALVIDPVLVAFCGALGSALGEMTGFCVGRCSEKMIHGKLVEWISKRMENHKYIIVLLFSFMPLPLFDVVGMLSGVMKMNTFKFFGVCFIGKLIKMLCYVGLAHELLPLMK